jgi:hypothetical protein
MQMNGFNRIYGGHKMFKRENTVGFLFVVTVLGVSLTLCSYNRLANTTWQATDGSRTVVFGETTVKWTREDTGDVSMGTTYTISQDAVTLNFDDGEQYTGSLIGNTLSFTVISERSLWSGITRTHVELHVCGKM